MLRCLHKRTSFLGVRQFSSFIPSDAKIINAEKYAQFPLVLAENEARGRHFIANRNIARGEIVLRTYPTASITRDENLKTHCHCCFRPLNGVLASVCPGCGIGAICARCRSNPMAHDIHEAACGALQIAAKEVQASKQNFSTVHQRFLSTLVGRIETDFNQVLEEEGYAGELSREKADELARAYMDGTPAEGLIIDSSFELFKLQGTAPGQVRSQEFTDAVHAFGDMHDPTRMKFIQSPQEIMHLYSAMSTNALSIRDEMTGATIGLTISPSASYFNHSCLPNCFHALDASGNIVFRAVSDVPCGEELTISYIQPYRPASDRQQRLKSMYGFQCKCAACASVEHETKLSGLKVECDRAKASLALGECYKALHMAREAAKAKDYSRSIQEAQKGLKLAEPFVDTHYIRHELLSHTLGVSGATKDYAVIIETVGAIVQGLSRTFPDHRILQVPFYFTVVNTWRALLKKSDRDTRKKYQPVLAKACEGLREMTEDCFEPEHSVVEDAIALSKTKL